ncbi:O-antigen transporter, putative [Microscilla marina ATCC 23134]|uniref:O-antigen transporter, putative n=2 Tax=Microscilla marina TaxID=1027 RepID=A1ZLQ6_MICM2|nr:O-antigen transporter, putative [Microscilla marina ATCC 23134]
MFFDKKMIENFASMSFLKLSNLVLGWLLYPYIIRLIGTDNFGLLIFAQSLMLYLVVFTNYGFSLSAPREIARLYKTKPKECIQKVSDFFYTQIFLGLVSFFLLFLLVQAIPFLGNNSRLIYGSFAIVLGQILLPVWFFQGIEKMPYLVYFNLFAKILLIVGIVLFVHQKSDYIFINLFWGLGSMIAGLGAWGVMIVRFKVRFYKPSYQSICHILRQDFHLFVANITNIITFNSTVIIMGLFATNETLGLYSIADRIFMIARQAVVVIHQSIYPRVAQLANESLWELKHFFKRFLQLILVFVVPATGILYFFAPEVVYLFAGKVLPEVSFFVQILSFTPLLAVANLPACQVLLVTNKEFTYTVLSMIGAVFHIILSLILIYNFAGYGAVLGLFCTELFLWLIFNFKLYQLNSKLD